jgi:hypothetical protein
VHALAVWRACTHKAGLFAVTEGEKHQLRLQIIPKAAVAVMAVIGATSFAAQPASAEPAEPGTIDSSSVVTARLGTAEGQFDNNPGDGATSWAWGYSGQESQVEIFLRLADQSVFEFGFTGKNQSGGVEPPQKILAINVCVLNCSGWIS